MANEDESMEDVENGRKRTSASDAAPPSPKRQQSHRSPAWLIFTELRGPGRRRGKCNYCGSVILCDGKAGTNGLIKHTESCQVYKKSKENKSNKILTRDGTTSEDSGKLGAVGNFCQERCKRATVKMIILNELPFSFVENRGFRYFCSQTIPKYNVPSRRTITKEVLNLFVAEKASLKSVLSTHRVSFTTDIWTAITTVSYMVITAHFIDENWKLHRKIISFSPISDHKGNTIAKQFEKCLVDWNIKKVSTITVDNASANDRAVRLLKEKWKKTLGADGLILDGDFLHVRCAAHILNLIVGEGLKKMGRSVLSIRNAVKYVRGSWSRLQAFQTRSNEGKVSRGSLVLDCDTRWNSTYFMLSSALKFRTAFDRIAEEDKLYDAYFHEDDTLTEKMLEDVTLTARKRVGPPVNKDWESAEMMEKFLSVFYDATLAFSASTKVTSSGCLNEICKVERVLKTVSEDLDSDPILRATARAMRYDKFDKYWDGFEKINKLLIVAAVLDPRFKMGFVTLCFTKLYGLGNSKIAEMKAEIMSLMRRLYDVYNASYKSSAESTKVSGSQDQPIDGLDEGFDLSDVGVQEKEKDDPFGEWCQMAADTESVDESSNELDLYLLEKIHNPKANSLGVPFDILGWWKVNGPKYPVLALLAKDVLAIPVSTVSSESAFSTGGRILDEYRSCLASSTVEALILTQNWLRTSPQYDVGLTVKQVMDEQAFMDKVGEEMQKNSITVGEE